MGSINFSTEQNPLQYSYTSVHNYKMPQHSHFQEIGNVDAVGAGDNRLVILINSAYYFLECVYILYNKENYHLVVLHHGRVLTDRNYKTLKGAKIAFQKLYKNKSWKPGVKASWTSQNKNDVGLSKQKDELEIKEPLKAYSI